jgi:signal transduction histidine kinase
VVSLNPAAERITGIRAGAARGKTWQQLRAEGRLLPALPADSTQPAEAEMELPDMALGSGAGARHYAPALSTLRDFRGLLMGYLLMLRDVTDQKRAQAQLLAQRWAQAILLEREQLAHELHDGLSQDLAFLNVQAQAAELYLQTGQEETARASVARLAEVSREMAGDVRDLIGNLLVVSLPSEGFCTTLRHIVTRFEKQNGLPVYLDIDDPTEALCGPTLLAPDVGVQLVRIVQEALTNVRRHAGASNYIGVRLRVEAGQMELAITDNGAGFEPDAPGTDGQHFGLQVMRQRAASIGGQLAVHSAPGQGTRVEVRVPLASDEIGSAA